MAKVRVRWTHAGHAQETVYDADDLQVSPSPDSKPGVLLVRKDSRLVGTVKSWDEASYVDDDEECGTRRGNPIAMPLMMPPPPTGTP
jgi:hypothetical protein